MSVRTIGMGRFGIAMSAPPPIFERDPNQDNVPDGHTAYLLRWWYSVFSGYVAEERFYNGLAHLTYERESEERLPASIGEVSRVFVRNTAPVKPAVFDIESKPLPKELPRRG